MESKSVTSADASAAIERMHSDIMTGVAGDPNDISIVSARLREQEVEIARLREDRDRGLRIAYGVTLECQTVEEAIADLVRMVRAGRTP